VTADNGGDEARLIDLERIRALAIVYCRALDTEDTDLLKSVYWPDATDDHGKLFAGRAWEFADTFVGMRTRVRPTMHLVFNHIITFADDDPELAHGVCYGVGYQFAHARPTPRARAVLGVYFDEYQRRGTQWRILSRRFDLTGTMTEATGGTAP
jgi:hypothetical protein